MGALPSRLVPRGPKADDRLVQGFEDRNLEPYEVVLSRSEYEAWGLAWNVRAHAAKRLQVAGVDPCSPAGRWNQGQQAAGLRGIRRGDELFEVNGYSGHSGMREQLSASRAARLLFRPDSQDLAIPKLHPMESKIGPDSVKNTFIHYGNSRDDADTTDDIQPRRLSLSDPLPLSSLPMQLEDDRLSEASFYSVDSCASSLSRSSGSQNQPSSVDLVHLQTGSFKATSAEMDRCCHPLRGLDPVSRHRAHLDEESVEDVPVLLLGS